jgi:hypothetical protein
LIVLLTLVFSVTLLTWSWGNRGMLAGWTRPARP